MAARGKKEEMTTERFVKLSLIAIVVLLFVIALSLYRINTTIWERDDCGGSAENPCHVQVITPAPAKGDQKK